MQCSSLERRERRCFWCKENEGGIEEEGGILKGVWGTLTRQKSEVENFRSRKSEEFKINIGFFFPPLYFLFGSSCQIGLQPQPPHLDGFLTLVNEWTRGIESLSLSRDSFIFSESRKFLSDCSIYDKLGWW